MPQAIELLINMGSRQSREKAPLVLTALTAHGLTPSRVTRLKRDDNLNQRLKTALRRRPDLIIIGGGDGTISEAVDQLVGQKIEVGLLPLGTTNNFVRSLNIPLNIPEAVKTIAERPARPVDLGRANGNYFTNVAGIGLSAQIAGSVTDKLKRRLGRLAYGWTGLRELYHHQAFKVSLEDKDHELTIHFETHQLIVANGGYHAGRQIARDARPDNGRLVIFALGSRSKLSFAWHVLDYYVGRRRQVAHESYVTGNNIVIRTDRPQPVELDGEVTLTTPLNIDVVTGSLLVRH